MTHDVLQNGWQLHRGQNIEQLMRYDYVQDIEEMKNGPALNFFFKAEKRRRDEAHLKLSG